jgi:hypothetical protein
MKNLIKKNISILMIISFGILFSLTAFAENSNYVGSIQVNSGIALTKALNSLNTSQYAGENVVLQLTAKHISGVFVIGSAKTACQAASITIDGEKNLDTKTPDFYNAGFTVVTKTPVLFKNISFDNEGITENTSAICGYTAGNITISNCSFSNFKLKGFFKYGNGTVVSSSYNSGDLSLYNCTFKNCYSERICTQYPDDSYYCYGSAVSKYSGKLSIFSCSFINCHNACANTDASYGGAVALCSYGGSLKVLDCYFNGCRSTYGGAIYKFASSFTNIDNIYVKCVAL